MIVIPVLLSLVAVCVVTFVLYLKWTFSYWSKRNVFTFPPSFPFGNAKDQFYKRATFSEQIAEVYKVAKKKGLPYCGYHFFLQPIFVPTDIELVRKILTVDFQHFTDHTNYINEDVDPLSGNLFSLKGAKWKALRSKLTPLFSSGKLKMMFQTLVDCTKDLPTVLDEAVASDSPIDIKDTFARYTTDVIASVGFGIECNCLKNPDNEFREYGKKLIEVEGLQAIKTLFVLLMPKILELARIPNSKKDVQNFFLGLTKETVGYRDKNKYERQDFIQLLMKLRNQEIKTESSTNKNNTNDGIAYYQNGLTMNEIAAQAFVFFFAGFETSSTTLNFMMYELTTHPEIQDKLREEIIQVLAKHDGKITYEAIQEMTYLDKCTYETLRKYPPVPFLPRKCTKSYKVPGSDLTIEKDTVVLIPSYGIHHDPEIYPEPEKYDPERFSDEKKGKRSPFTFLAFGEGPRICIGLRLGLLQTKVGLVAMLKDYKFTLNSKTQLPIKLEPFQFIMTAKGGIWVDPCRFKRNKMIVLLEVFAVTIASFITFVILFYKWNFDYWKRKNVFTFEPTIPFGNFKPTFFRKISSGMLVSQLYKDLRAKGLKYGGLFMFFQPFLLISDLDLIKNILVKDFQSFSDHINYINEKVDPLTGNLFRLSGARWKALRIKLTPTFTSGKIKMMFETIVDCTKHLPGLMDECVGRSEPIDIKETMARFTTDIIGSVAFGIDCNCLKNPDTEFRKYGKRIFEGSFRRRITVLLSFCVPQLLKLFRIPVHDKEMERFFSTIIKDTIDYRENHNIDRKDFLKLLIQLKNQKISLEGKHSNGEAGNTVLYSQDGLSLNEITAQAFVFFVAGFETSSTALTFLMYELVMNLDIQEKLRNEINTVLEKHNGEITYEAIMEMEYLDKCFLEVLRKHPPGTALSRMCTKAYKIPGTGVELKKGDRIFISVYGIHHDPEYYPDPEKFDPERFSEGEKSKRDPFAFLPFGEGPRICIGLRFAAMQVKVAIVALLKDYRFTLNAKTQTPMEYDPVQVIISVKGGVWLNAERL
ncbi:uncharacterized protein LOC108732805 [Agrilus planipennis]|uniref:Uncharacterized protein LOC108732805 n=1 Tax=Agrilus planipennis TaxID=224129 RepID=A0A1W4WGX6_AGRPL|nr:uncharacterized protein LOC108732805 [Agrilus planipennis]